MEEITKSEYKALKYKMISLNVVQYISIYAFFGVLASACEYQLQNPNSMLNVIPVDLMQYLHGCWQLIAITFIAIRALQSYARYTSLTKCIVIVDDIDSKDASVTGD